MPAPRHNALSSTNTSSSLLHQRHEASAPAARLKSTPTQIGKHVRKISQTIRDAAGNVHTHGADRQEQRTSLLLEADSRQTYAEDDDQDSVALSTTEAEVGAHHVRADA